MGLTCPQASRLFRIEQDHVGKQGIWSFLKKILMDVYRKQYRQNQSIQNPAAFENTIVSGTFSSNRFSSLAFAADGLPSAWLILKAW